MNNKITGSNKPNEQKRQKQAGLKLKISQLPNTSLIKRTRKPRFKDDLKKKDIYLDFVNPSHKMLQFYSNKIIKSDATSISRGFFTILSDWALIKKRLYSNLIAQLSFQIVAQTYGVSLGTVKNKDRQFIRSIFYHLSQPASAIPALINVSYQTFTLKGILIDATKAYFYYFNSFHPLFEEDAYFKKPRSNLLKLAIYNTGLRFLPKSSFRDKLMADFETKLIKSFKPSKLKFNLDTAQAILVYSMGIYWGRCDGFKLSLFRLASSILRSFGLEQNAPKYLRSRNDFIEIIFAIRYLIFIDSVLYVFAPSYFPDILYNGFFDIIIPNSNKKSNLQVSLFSTTFNWDFSLNLIEPNITIQQLSSILRLISTDCTCKSNCTLKELNHLIMKEQNDNYLSILKFIHQSIMKLNQIYKVYFKISSKMLNYIIQIGIQDLLATEKYKREIILVGKQQFHITKLYMCYILTRILDYTPHLTIDKLKPNIKPLYYSLMNQHLVHAIQLFQCIREINPLAPFAFHQSRMLSIVARVIIKHIYSRSSADYLSVATFISTSSLFEILNQTIKMIETLKEVDYHFVASSAYLVVVRALCNQYKLTLPN